MFPSLSTRRACDLGGAGRAEARSAEHGPGRATAPPNRRPSHTQRASLRNPTSSATQTPEPSVIFVETGVPPRRRRSRTQVR